MTLEDQIRAIVDAAVKDALAKLKPAAEHVTVAEYARRWSLSTLEIAR